MMDYDTEKRYCDVCGKEMDSGYLIEDTEHYCSRKCLRTKYTIKEYLQMYQNDAAYWTEWD